MKQQLLSLYTGWTIISFEILLSLVLLLSVLMVNGTDYISSDHIALLAIFLVTITSILFMNTRKPAYKRAVVWLAVMPFAFTGYEGLQMIF